MPFYLLSKKLSFPDPNKADESGLLAIGGDLSVDRLKLAYSNGIFPWYSDNNPILWWSPDPRMILFLYKFKVLHSLKQTLNKRKFNIKFDNDFDKVITYCSEIYRGEQNGTWITEDMKKAYIKLFEKGYAHSVETYYENKLVGGLYGVSLGRAFFGESMFHLVSDASKVAFYFLFERLKLWNFEFIDIQLEAKHFTNYGAELIPRSKFLLLLKKTLESPTKKGKW